MKKVIISLLICFSLLFNFATPAIASTNTSTDVIRAGENELVLSDASHIKLTYLPNDGTSSSASVDEMPFSVKQYQGDQLVQEVTGYVGGPTIQIIDYDHGKVVAKTTRNISDFVTKTSEPTSVAPFASAISNHGTVLGHIVYNKAYGSNEEKVISVYSKIEDCVTEAYAFHALATDSINAIVGALIGAGLGLILGPVIDIPALVASIVTSLGGSVVGNIVGIAIDDTVAVSATYYTLCGYHAPTKYYSPGYDGVARLVLTKNNKAYNQWFYEGYTPHNWRDGPLATMLYLGTFGGTFPYVKEYR